MQSSVQSSLRRNSGHHDRVLTTQRIVPRRVASLQTSLSSTSRTTQSFSTTRASNRTSCASITTTQSQFSIPSFSNATLERDSQPSKSQFPVSLSSIIAGGQHAEMRSGSFAPATVPASSQRHDLPPAHIRVDHQTNSIDGMDSSRFLEDCYECNQTVLAMQRTNVNVEQELKKVIRGVEQFIQAQQAKFNLFEQIASVLEGATARSNNNKRPQWSRKCYSPDSKTTQCIASSSSSSQYPSQRTTIPPRRLLIARPSTCPVLTHTFSTNTKDFPGDDIFSF